MHAFDPKTKQSHAQIGAVLWNLRVSSAKFSKFSPAAGKIGQAEKPSLDMPANGLSDPPESPTHGPCVAFDVQLRP